MTPTEAKLRQTVLERKFIHLALLLMMQVGFTLFGLLLLNYIVAPFYLWVFWITYQVIGWTFFVWQFVSIGAQTALEMYLQEELDNARNEIKEAE